MLNIDWKKSGKGIRTTHNAVCYGFSLIISRNGESTLHEKKVYYWTTHIEKERHVYASKDDINDLRDAKKWMNKEMLKLIYPFSQPKGDNQFESKVKRRWNNGCFIRSTKRDNQGLIKRSQREGPGDKGTESRELQL
jgi:hypothetical protein